MADFTGRGSHRSGSSQGVKAYGTGYDLIRGTSGYAEATFDNWYEMITYSHQSYNGAYIDGGPWHLWKTEQRGSPGKVVKVNGAGRTLFEGHVLPRHNFVSNLAPVMMNDSEMDQDGASALSKVYPTEPHAAFSTFMGELLGDGLPSMAGHTLWKDRAAVARGAGGEYLNVVFGWLPLLADLQAFSLSVNNTTKIISQYRKDSDKKIKRRFYYDTVQTQTFANGGGFVYPSEANIGYDAVSTLTSYHKRWFEGAFRYHVPMGDDVISRLKRYNGYANILLGTNVTPEMVWNIAPWSWAIDWFTNVGDVMTNVSRLGSDGLVMQYGYQMSEKSIQQRTVGTTKGSGVTKAGMELITTRSTKQRRPANPYGFGADGFALTPRQIAVVAALGLSST